MATSQLTGAGWIVFGASLLLAAIALVYIVLSPRSTRVAAWASHHGLTMTASTYPIVAGYLRTTRLLQLGGTTIGWSASPLYIGLAGRPFPLGDSWVALALAGYLVGTVVAEAARLIGRDPAPRIRTAALSPRTLSNYVPAAAIWAIRLLPVAMLFLAALYAVVPKNSQRAIDPSVAFLAVASIVVVGFAVLVDRLLGSVVAQPQHAAAADLLAADDAIRASSIHALSAAAVALLMLGVGWGLFSVGTATSIALLSQVLPWCGLICDVLALVTWIWLAHLSTWRVRRDASLVPGK